MRHGSFNIKESNLLLHVSVLPENVFIHTDIR